MSTDGNRVTASLKPARAGEMSRWKPEGCRFESCPPHSPSGFTVARHPVFQPFTEGGGV